MSWLEQEAGGLIALTGAGGGPVDQAMREGHPDLARARLGQLKSTFGDRLYLELQRQRGYDRAHEAKMIALAYACEVPLVAANEAFFPTPDDFEAHDALMAVASNAVMSDDRRRRLSVDNCLKSRAEMMALFAEYSRGARQHRRDRPALQRHCRKPPADPAEIYRRRRRTTPKQPLPLKRLNCGASRSRGWSEGLPGSAWPKDLRSLITASGSRPSSTSIESMKFPGYFLIVADFIQWAKGQGIPVGPGRGSGAGSLVAYALTITDVDPLRFSLLFERFPQPCPCVDARLRHRFLPGPAR